MDFADYKSWTEWSQQLVQPFIKESIEFLPKLALGLIVLLLGWILAKVIRMSLSRLCRSLDRLMNDYQSNIYTRWPISSILGGVAYWFILILFVSISTEVIGLVKLSNLFRSFFAFLPTLTIGVGIIIVGHILSIKARRTLLNSQLAHKEILSQSAGFVGIVFSIILGCAQMGLDTGLLVNLVTIIVAMLFGGAALAFGLGAGTTVSNIMSAHYLRKSYAKGQHVKVLDTVGKLVEIGQNAVIISSKEGTVSIPAKIFAENVVLILQGDSHGA